MRSFLGIPEATRIQMFLTGHSQSQLNVIVPVLLCAVVPCPEQIVSSSVQLMT
jgi:hypothetical protein